MKKIFSILLKSKMRQIFLRQIKKFRNLQVFFCNFRLLKEQAKRD